MERARVVLMSAVGPRRKGMKAVSPLWTVLNPTEPAPGSKPDQLAGTIKIKKVMTSGKN